MVTEKEQQMSFRHILGIGLCTLCPVCAHLSSRYLSVSRSRPVTPPAVIHAQVQHVFAISLLEHEKKSTFKPDLNFKVE